MGSRARLTVVAVVLAVGLAACGNDDTGVTADPVGEAGSGADASEGRGGSMPGDEESASGADTSSDAAAELGSVVEQVISENRSELDPFRFAMDADPLEDLDLALEMNVETSAAIGRVLDQLPALDAVDLADGAQSTAYRDLLASLESWKADIDAVVVDLRADFDSFVTLSEEFFSSPPGPPPAELLVVIDAAFAGDEPFSQACAEFAVAFEVAPDCFGGADGGPPEPADPGVVAFDIGAFSGTFEPGVVGELFTQPDFVGIDLGPTAAMKISTPPEVADPDNVVVPPEVLDELFPEVIEEPLPWPNDVDAWVEAMPLTVRESGEVDLGGRTFDYWEVERAGDDDIAVFVDPYHPEGANNLRAASVIRWWEGDLDGVRVVAILKIDGAADVGAVVEQAEAILASIEAVA